jgi:hypothetical protein
MGRANKLEEESSDLYSFGFDQTMNNFGNQSMQEIIGSNKKIEEKKNSTRAIQQ